MWVSDRLKAPPVEADTRWVSLSDEDLDALHLAVFDAGPLRTWSRRRLGPKADFQRYRDYSLDLDAAREELE